MYATSSRTDADEVLPSWLFLPSLLLARAGHDVGFALFGSIPPLPFRTTIEISPFVTPWVVIP